MSKKDVTQRWKDQPGLAAAVARWLSDTAAPLPEGIGTLDGRVDLRGLPTFPAGNVRELRGVRWSGLDLTYADLSGLWFFDVVIEDCILDQASLKNSRLLGVVCNRTSLVGADLQQATVGGATADSWPTWTDVDFSKAKLGRRMWSGVTITRCTFTDTKMKGTEFYRCSISDTTFATDLSEVIFDGKRSGLARDLPFPEQESVVMQRVDLSRSRLMFTGFRTCTMEGVSWPEDPKVRVILDPADVVEKAAGWLEAQDGRGNSAAAKGLRRLMDEVNVLLPDGTPFVVVNLAEWEQPSYANDMEAALFGEGQSSS